MCLKILYALFVVGVRGGGAFFAQFPVWPSQRISLITNMTSGEAFVQTLSAAPPRDFVELLAHLAHSRRENATKC